MNHYLDVTAFIDEFKKTKECEELKKAIETAFQTAKPVENGKINDIEIREVTLNEKLYWLIDSSSSLSVVEITYDFIKEHILKRPDNNLGATAVIPKEGPEVKNQQWLDLAKQTAESLLQSDTTTENDLEKLTEECYKILESSLSNKSDDLILPTDVSMLKVLASDFSVNISDDVIRQSYQSFCKVAQIDLDEFLLNIDYLEEVMVAKKKTESKPFVFNDLDNKVWFDENLVLSDQNLGFYCEKNESGLVVYVWDKEFRKSEMATSLKDLKQRIKDNKTTLVDIALEVSGGEVTYTTQGLAYCLGLNLQFSKNACVDNGYPRPKYPVDIYSYDYQRNYYAKKHGYDEISFLHQALAVCGSGFHYDKKTKSIYDSSVSFVKNMGQAKQKSDRALTKIYGGPLRFGELTPEWQNGVKKFLNALKMERPEVMTGSNDKKENSKELDKIITQFENEILKFGNAKPVKNQDKKISK